MKASFPLTARAEAAAACAATFADDVDERARFPDEAIDAFRRFELLGALVPERLDGPGCTLAEVAAACRVLGRACGSSALIYAMHQIQVACLLPDSLPFPASPSDASPGSASGPGSEPWTAAFLRRVGAEQLLLASVTSEIGIGGNIRTSACVPIRINNRLELFKRSPAISYGAHADAFLVTARRDADAPPSDQILVVAEKHQAVLTETARWNTLGMRGTDSRAFDIRVTVGAEQVLPTLFAELAQHTMLPVSHILWGSAWLGIAADAVEKAREFLRRQFRTRPDALPLGAVRLERAVSVLLNMEARLDRTWTTTAAFSLPPPMPPRRRCRSASSPR